MKIVVAFMVLLSVAAASAQTQLPDKAQVYEKIAYQRVSEAPTPEKAPKPIVPVPKKKH